MRQYNPLQVTASWTTPTGAVDIVDGAIADGDFLSIERDNDNFTREHDLAGNATRVFNANRGGRFTVILSASSPTNTALSARVVADRVAQNIVGAFVSQDLNGDSVIEADDAFLVGPPRTITYGQSRGSRAWVFEAGTIRNFVGGHNVIGEE